MRNLRACSIPRARRGCNGARQGRVNSVTFSVSMGTRGSHPHASRARRQRERPGRGRVDPTTSGVLSGPRRSSPHASRARRRRVSAQHHPGSRPDPSVILLKNDADLDAADAATARRTGTGRQRCIGRGGRLRAFGARCGRDGAG
jgi:hypothetical protein